MSAGRRTRFRCASSVGAINAAALASHALNFGPGVKQLASFWEELSVGDIYRIEALFVALRGLHWIVTLTPLAGLGIKPPRSLLDNAPLRNLLRARINFAGIQSAIDDGALRALAISASSYYRSNAVTFFQGAPDLAEWKRARHRGVAARITLDHLLGSSALPIVFPAQKIGDDYYGDGSLRLTAPLAPAVHAGADRILVIGVRDEPPITSTAGNGSYPSLGRVGGYMLDTIFMDNLDADIERLQRINETIARIAPENSEGLTLRPISVLTTSAKICAPIMRLD